MDRIKDLEPWVGLVGGILGLVGAILDVWLALQGKLGLSLCVLVVLLLVAYSVQLSLRLKSREDIMQFVAFLFTHKHGSSNGFSLLPKICIELDRTKKVNKVHITELEFTSTCDLSEYNNGVKNCGEKHKKLKIRYPETQEYNLKVLNRHLPKNYIYYVGNVYSEGTITLSESHGKSEPEYSEVDWGDRSNKIGASPYLREYPWILKKENIPPDQTIIPINFKIEFTEKEYAKSTSVIIIYPKRYGEKIDRIKVTLNYKCEMNVLKGANLYEIARNESRGTYQRASLAGMSLDGNKATIEFTPNYGWTDAYFIMVDLEVPITENGADPVV